MAEIVSGTDALGAMALGRVKRLSYAGLAADLKISAERFRDFAEGRLNLPVETLQMMTKLFFSSAVYDTEHDRLRPANTAPQLTYIYPPPLTPPPQIKYEYGGAAGPRLVSSPLKPAPKTKPGGWLGGWF